MGILSIRRLLCALLFTTAWAQAATITVNTTSDTTANDGQCSLREAVTASNDQTASGDAQGECAAGSDEQNIITLPAGTFNLSNSLTLSSDIRLNGAGMNESLIDGGNTVRVLYLNSGYRLSLNGVRIIGGNVSGSGGGLYMATGSFARIENSRFSANEASSNGGAIFLDDEAYLDVFSSTFTNNNASSGGAIYSDYGVVSLSGSTLSGNSASSEGGAVYLYIGNLTARSSELSGNSADDGGALYVYYSSNVQLEDVTVDNNTASSDGGGINLYDYSLLRITGGSVSNNSASANGGGVYAYYSSLELDDVAVAGNSASSNGGGLYVEDGQAYIQTSSIDTNTAGSEGGGFYLDYPGAIRLDNTNLVANHADSGGGAGYAYYGQLFMRDGRIADNTSDGVAGGLGLEGNPAHLERIAVINNTAQGNGGGLYFYDYSGVVMRNATVSGNDTTSGAGGGIYLESGASLEMAHSTITDNEASSEGGGIHATSDAKLAYQASIVAGNRANDGDDCYIDTTILSRGFNVFADDTDCVTDATDLDIASNAVTTSLLSPLADNGGPTPTHALRSGSLADNAADNQYCPLTDQRGTARQQNGFNCDIGAYERINETSATSSGGGGSLPGWGVMLLGGILLCLRKPSARPATKSTY